MHSDRTFKQLYPCRSENNVCILSKSNLIIQCKFMYTNEIQEKVR